LLKEGQMALLICQLKFIEGGNQTIISCSMGKQVAENKFAKFKFKIFNTK